MRPTQGRGGPPRIPLIWPCSTWGLPSCRRHRRHWWALTPPFHPYRSAAANDCLYERRYCFCGTCLGFPPLGVTQHAARGVPTFLYRKHRSTRQRFPCLVDRDVIRLPVALLLWWRIIGIDYRDVTISCIDSSGKVQDTLHPSIEYEIVTIFGCKLLNRRN